MRFEKYRAFVFYPELAQKFNVPPLEYMVIEAIRYLSTSNPNYPWCTATRDNIAKFCGGKKRTVHRTIKFGFKTGLIEKDGTKLRTSEIWNSAIMGIKSAEKSAKVASFPDIKSAKMSPQSAKVASFPEENVPETTDNQKEGEAKTLDNNKNKSYLDNTKVLSKKEIYKLSDIIFTKWNDLTIVSHLRTANHNMPAFFFQTISAKVKNCRGDIQPIIDAMSLYAALYHHGCIKQPKGLVAFLRFAIYEEYIPNRDWGWYPFNEENGKVLKRFFDNFEKYRTYDLKSIRERYAIINYVYEFQKRFIYDESKIYSVMKEWWDGREVKRDTEDTGEESRVEEENQKAD